MQKNIDLAGIWRRNEVILMSMPRDDTILMLFARLGRFIHGSFLQQSAFANKPVCLQ